MHQASLLVAVLLAIQVVINDLYARRVANRALVAALVAAVLTMVVVPEQSTSPGKATIGIVAGLLSLLPFYAIRWMGAGDVKCFAVLGFVLGWPYLLPVWVGASLMAGIHALAVIASRKLLLHSPYAFTGITGRALSWYEKTPLLRRALIARQGRQGIPYAAYLGGSVLIIAISGVRYG